MNAKRIAPVITVLAILVACEDQPTAVNEVDNLEPQLINTDKGNWIELEAWRVDWEFSVTGPCVPEPLLCEGTTVAWAKEKIPPGRENNSIFNFKSTYTPDTHCTGAQTGRWDLAGQTQSSVHIMTKPSDGKEYWTASLIDHYRDQDTGDKLHIQTVIWYVFDPPVCPSLPCDPPMWAPESFRIKESCGPNNS